MIIAIAGTPGTGKTTLANLLAKELNFTLIDVNELAKKTSSKKEKGEYTANLTKLRNSILKDAKNKNTIIEGHLTVELKLPAEILIILRCNPNQLEKRLKKRKYSKRKILDNLLCEVQNYSRIIAQNNYPNTMILEIDTTKFPTISHLTAKLAKGGDEVDFSKQLLKLAKRDATTP